MQKNGRTKVFGIAGSLGTYALTTCVLVLAGCAQPASRVTCQSQCEAAIGQICVPDIGKAETMALAEDILGHMHFTIEKADIASGVMRTRPLPGAQFFEFWRSDNVGPDNSFLANLHTIRRTVELNISRCSMLDTRYSMDRQFAIADCRLSIERQSLIENRKSKIENPDGYLCIHCKVRVQRLSLPERQISSSARAYEMFSRSSSSLQRLTLNPQQQKNMAWIDLDNDAPLAQEILRHIEAEIAHQASNEQQSTGNKT